MTITKSTRYKDADAWRMERGDLSVTLLPYGAKIQSIRWGGREWLCQREGASYRFAPYGAAFESGEFSGFDEMFPTISACDYPAAPFRGTALPDHGEVWAMPWAVHETGGELRCSVRGRALPYALEKRVSLLPDALTIRYRAQNLCDQPLSYLWAAHPLFVLEDGMRVELPGCVTVFNALDGCDNLGAFGAIHPWRVCASGRDIGLLSGENRTFQKYYAWNARPQNAAQLHYPGGTRIALESDAPHMGMWVDECGYGDQPMRCVAPEPCTAAPDRLDWAETYGRSSALPPRGEACWQLSIAFSSANRNIGRKIDT